MRYIITLTLIGVASIIGCGSFAMRPQLVTGNVALIQVETIERDGVTRLDAMVTRHERLDGSWRFFRTTFTPEQVVAHHDSGVGIPGRGVFAVDSKNQELILIDGYPAVMRPTRQQMKAAPTFLRWDTVLDYSVAVFRQGSGQRYREEYRCPELGGAVLKIVSRSPDQTSIMRTVRIEPSVLSDKDLIPDWPVTTRFAEKRAAALESQGAIGQAESARAAIRLLQK